MKMTYILAALLILTGCEETRGHGISKRIDPASEKRFYTACLEKAGDATSDKVVATCGREASTMEYDRAEAAYYRDKFADQIARTKP